MCVCARVSGVCVVCVVCVYCVLFIGGVLRGVSCHTIAPIQYIIHHNTTHNNAQIHTRKSLSHTPHRATQPSKDLPEPPARYVLLHQRYGGVLGVLRYCSTVRRPGPVGQSRRVHSQGRWGCRRGPTISRSQAHEIGAYMINIFYLGHPLGQSCHTAPQATMVQLTAGQLNACATPGTASPAMSGSSTFQK